MTEITDLSETDSANTEISTYSVDGNIANMSSTDNVFQAVLGLLKRSLKSSIWRLRDSTDQTKLLAFDLSGLASGTTTVKVLGTNGTMVLPPFIAGHLWGVTVANNATDATNDIDVAAGVAVDSTHADIIQLTGTLVKRLDAAWTVGSNQGMRDTGAIANGWWHVYLIKRPDTGAVDIIASLSAAAPTLPANYTLYRRIWSILRVAGVIKQFSQIGDTCLWDDETADTSAANPGTLATLTTVSSPLGVACTALINFQVGNSAATQLDMGIRVASPFSNGNGATEYNSDGVRFSANAIQYIRGRAEVITNALSQIRYSLTASNATTIVNIGTYGYVDRRGKDA